MDCCDIYVMLRGAKGRGGGPPSCVLGNNKKNKYFSLSVTDRRCAEEDGPCAERKAGQRAAGRFAGQNGR